MGHKLRDMLIRHEGLRLRPYRNTVGKLTIGVGRNLDDVGITRKEALRLLDHDIAKVRREVKRAFVCFPRQNTVRQNVVLNMVFNLRLPRFLRFRKTIAACSHRFSWPGPRRCFHLLEHLGP